MFCLHPVSTWLADLPARGQDNVPALAIIPTVSPSCLRAAGAGPGNGPLHRRNIALRPLDLLQISVFGPWHWSVAVCAILSFI